MHILARYSSHDRRARTVPERYWLAWGQCEPNIAFFSGSGGKVVPYADLRPDFRANSPLRRGGGWVALHPPVLQKHRLLDRDTRGVELNEPELLILRLPSKPEVCFPRHGPL